MKYLQAVGYSKASCNSFSSGIKEFLWCIEKLKIMSIDQVEESDIENFYNYQQERPGITTGESLSESRITLNMYVLKLFFQHLQDIEQIAVNPMGNLDYVRAYKRTRENLLSKADIAKLYDECQTAKQKAMLGIIYGCGLRRQEAVRLNASDIHFRNALLYVREGKGGRKRTIPLNSKVLSDLKEYYHHQRQQELKYNNPDTAFILNSHGTRMQGDGYCRAIKKLIQKSGLNQKISLHYFRHAIATHLLESGMKTEHVKDFLGHKSIETTQTYTHITTTQMKQTTAYEITTIHG
jgi:integrase/recombinase XerD